MLMDAFTFLGWLSLRVRSEVVSGVVILTYALGLGSS